MLIEIVIHFAPSKKYQWYLSLNQDLNPLTTRLYSKFGTIHSKKKVDKDKYALTGLKSKKGIDIPLSLSGAA
jgi:hypothetical protein